MEVLHALTVTCVMDSFRLGRDPTKVPAPQEWKEKLPLVRTGKFRLTVDRGKSKGRLHVRRPSSTFHPHTLWGVQGAGENICSS